MRLDDYVRHSYATILLKLEAQHIEYFFDAQHFGNELDRWTNRQMHIVLLFGALT